MCNEAIRRWETQTHHWFCHISRWNRPGVKIFFFGLSGGKKKAAVWKDAIFPAPSIFQFCAAKDYVFKIYNHNQQKLFSDETYSFSTAGIVLYQL